MLKLFDLSLKLSGFPIEKAKKEMETILAISNEDYQQYTIQKRKEIVAFHLQNNPFYRKFVGYSHFNHWEDLPILTKTDLQQPLQNRLSTSYLKNNYINKTSGSGGTPFIFAKDKYAHALTWAHTFAVFNWYNVNFNSSYQARFYGIPLNKKDHYKELLKDILSNRYRFPIFNLTDSSFDKILATFKQKKFSYINGYTSVIVLFAKFLKERKIVLKEVCPSLQVCMTTSEMLFNDDRILLKKQLGIPIVNEYGSSETGLIAVENTQDEWQVNSETLFVEILDNNNQAVPYGKEGKIVITSLYNKAHPFIRYEIGDIGALDEKSTWKKPILKQLIGRKNDVVQLPSGKKAPGLTFYYITKSIIQDNGNIKEFVIKQKNIDSFEVYYVSDNELNAKQKTAIKKAVVNYLEPNLNFKFIKKNNLQRTLSGKLKQFQSDLV